MNIKDYLECESLLLKMFKNLDFCFKSCSTTNKHGFMSLCTDNSNYYDIYMDKDTVGEVSKEFIAERVSIYGKPVNQTPKCGYLGEKGCRLETHRGPMCTGFACYPLEAHLRFVYFINYDTDEMIQSLSNVLTGKMTGKDLNNFKKELKLWVEKTEKKTKVLECVV
ncbi:MAG: hypothetical protein JW791_05295 [Nanoarchaeota archaeon]|nr:hypothetical protein [Nanoarchaeota archaeon]